MRELRVDLERCTLCQACVALCPFGSLSQSGDRILVGESCNLCGACVPDCPEGALELLGEDRPDVDLSDWKGIWVFAEHEGGRIAGVAGELLGEARRMAEVTGDAVSAVLLGSGISGLSADLIAHGADQVFVVDDPALASMSDEACTAVLETLVRQQNPGILLFGATSTGRSLAPRLAARLETGLTADCTGLEIEDDGLLVQTRPAFGGNIMATIVCRRHRPQMATVRPRVMKALPPDPARDGKVISVAVDGSAFKERTTLLEVIEEAGDAVKIEEADIVVAGGRGVGSAEGFEILRGLASALGAALAATRPVVDSGWIPYAHQVGQTGKTIGPKVYIACGISGAIQHLAGMRSSDVIIAINKNPDAPIMKTATYALVGDMFQIIPALIKELEKAKG